MKWLLFSLILGFANPAFAQKNLSELTPLNVIVQSPDFKTDLSRISYVLKRCAAIYTVTGGVMSEKMGELKSGKEMQDYGALLGSSSSELDQSLQKLNNPKKIMLSKQESLKITWESITRIVGIYLEDIQKNIDRTGDYFSSTYKSDLMICKNLDKYSKK